MSLENSKTVSVTVVIATLGGETLYKTISKINKGTIIPEEILICIPTEEASNLKNISLKNARVIKTECRGQVAQRIEGFKNASCSYVMQLDDDISLEKDCIEHLISVFESHGNNIAVAPSFINIKTGQSVYKKPERNIIVESILYWFMNGLSGYEPGRIDKSGTPVGIDANNTDMEELDVEWLAGGCVMHRKENLVLDNYYPYKGKAFGEDVIHSIILRNKGIKLLIEAKAICSLEVTPSAIFSIAEFFNNIKSDYKVRRYYLALISRKSFRIYAYYFFCIAGYFIKKIKF